MAINQDQNPAGPWDNLSLPAPSPSDAHLMGVDPNGPATPPSSTTPFPAPNPNAGPWTGVDPVKAAAFQKAGDWQGLFNYIVQGVNTPNGSTTLTNPIVVGDLKRYGFNVSPANSAGMTTKIQTPGGNWVRVLSGLPTGDSWTWVDQGAGGAGSNVGMAGATGAINSAYLAPFNDTFNPGKDTSLSQFTAPTAADVLSDPSYKFRLGQGEQSLEQSAAARGLLNSGGTLADVLKYGQDFASQEYGNIYNRNFNTWSANNNVGQSMYDRALGQFNLARDIFYQNQDRPFNKLLGVANLGANTTVQGG